MAAFGTPMLLALNWPPSPTLWNQCAAIGLQGAWIALQFRSCASFRSSRHSRESTAVLALCALALAAAISAGLPASIGWGMLGVVAAASFAIVSGSALPRTEGVRVLRALAVALTAAGLLNALISCAQVFLPWMPDGDVIARSSLSGRATGNLRQPNHLASLLLWSLIGAAALRELKVWGARAMVASTFVLVFALVLSGSRTGVLGTLLLALWGLCDRRLAPSSRRLLLLLPLVTLVMWLALSAWAHATSQAFAVDTRIMPGNGDISSSRFAIWSNTVAMIVRHPWTGVGFGEFNLAWTLSAFPHRPTAFFDHTHNLPLQLIVELGLPLGLLVVALLLLSLVRAGRAAWTCDGEGGIAKRAAFMMVLTIGVHSLLEYPLWYAYFLLPAALAWGLALSQDRDVTGSSSHVPAATPSATRAVALHAFVGAIIAFGATAALFDYSRVAVIYDPPDNAAPLEDRITRGQRSPLFGHHADYAAATAFGPPKAPLSPSQELAFKRAPHQLLDVRLMIAWSQALASQGDLDKARWLAARIREFRNPGADEYFAPCSDPAQAALAFQCQAPTREVHWREFVQR
jgi:hypothetical protein